MQKEKIVILVNMYETRLGLRDHYTCKVRCLLPYYRRHFLRPFYRDVHAVCVSRMSSTLDFLILLFKTIIES